MAEVVSLFIFRRDLRIQDNICLTDAARASSAVMPIFIYNEHQIDPQKNRYFNRRAFDFMNACVSDLQQACPELRLFRGSDDCDVIKGILMSTRIDRVFFNADTTPYARARDSRISDLCESLGVLCVQCTRDYDPIDITTSVPYQKFTPFYKRYASDVSSSASDDGGRRQRKKKPTFAACPTTPHSFAGYPISRQNNIRQRSIALDTLARISRGSFKDYAVTRDQIWNSDGTTHLSPFLNFGCVSIRETFAAVVLADNEPLFRELMWRTFYDQIAYHFPRVLEGRSLRIAFDNIDWWDRRVDSQEFEKWKTGRTGFPLVDAAMRELAKTGRMHNRTRMLTASFLVKTLRVDWRMGERWFAKQLLDYHPASNNGGWQWASSSGADSQPYFRSLSPWIQSKKHDPDAVYVKRHVPELERVPAKDIHKWHTAWRQYVDVIDYPPPMVDHTFETKKTIGMMRRRFV